MGIGEHARTVHTRLFESEVPPPHNWPGPRLINCSGSTAFTVIIIDLLHMINPPCIELLWWLSGWSSIKQRHTPYVSVGGGVIIVTHSLHSFTTLHMSCMYNYYIKGL